MSSYSSRRATTRRVGSLALGFAVVFLAAEAHAQGFLDQIKREAERALREAQKSQPPSQPSAPVESDAGGAQRSNGAEGSGPKESARLAGITRPPADYRSPSGAEKLDIVGVHIGMPAEEAISAVRAHNPRLQFQALPIRFSLWNQPALAVLDFKTPDGEQGHERILLRLALPPNPSVVTEIHRRSNYAQGKEVTVEVVTSNLQRKYGPLQQVPARQTNDLSYVIYIDSKGTAAAKPGNCFPERDPIEPTHRAANMQHVSEIIDQFQRLNESLRFSQQLATHCGALVTATVTPDRNRALTREFNVRAANQHFLFETMKASADHLAKLDAIQKSAEAAKAKGRDVKM